METFPGGKIERTGSTWLDRAGVELQIGRKNWKHVMWRNARGQGRSGTREFGSEQFIANYLETGTGFIFVGQLQHWHWVFKSLPPIIRLLTEDPNRMLPRVMHPNAEDMIIRNEVLISRRFTQFILGQNLNAKERLSSTI